MPIVVNHQVASFRLAAQMLKLSCELDSGRDSAFRGVDLVESPKAGSLLQYRGELAFGERFGVVVEKSKLERLHSSGSFRFWRALAVFAGADKGVGKRVS